MVVKITSWLCWVAAVCVGPLAVCPTVRAEAAATNAPVLLVTATRDARLLKDAPYATRVLSATVLRIDKAVRTVPEALEGEPSTMVQKTAHGQGSPYIRGFTSQRNLFMVDGVRLNNSVFREGPNPYWNTVDAMGLSRIELVRGPFSTLYGSDAIGGTVNAITRGVGDIRPGRTWDRTLNYRYSSAEDSHILRAESIGQLTDRLALTLGYTRKDFGDVEGGREVGTQPRTGYDERSWDAKLEYFLNDDSVLVLARQSARIDDAWRTHKTIYGIDWEGLSVGSERRRVLDQARDLTYLQYHQYDAAGFAEDIHAGVSHQLQSETRDRLRSGDRHDVQGFDVHTYGAFVSFKSPSAIGNLIYGAEYYHDEVDSFSDTYGPDGALMSRALQGPVGDDATYDTLGLYLQDEIALSERLLLILGGRYEYAEAEAGTVEDPVTGGPVAVAGDWDDVVGSARLLCALNSRKTVNAFAGISQGFRAPNLSDLTRLDSARTDEIETPSPDLDPERFVSCEIGVKVETDVCSAQLALFHTAIDGMIVRTPTGRMIEGDYEVTKKNGGDGFVQGVEFDARYRLYDALTVFGVLSWQDGEVETYPSSNTQMVTDSISRLMPPTGTLGLRWDIGERYWLEGSCTVAGAGDKLSTRDQSDTSRIPPGGTPGYTVCDLRAGWTPREGMAFCLAVENLSDEDYRIHGSGLNEPGRNLVLAMEATF